MRTLGLWIAILVSAGAVRLALLAPALRDADHRVMTPDSQGYVQLARALRQRGRFAGGRQQDEPEIFRTPGYPAFLALLGPDEPDGSADGRWVLIVQILLDVGLVMLTYWLGKTLVDARIGLLAAMFQAFSPLAAASCCRILSDSLYTFFFIAAVLWMVRHLRGGGWRALVASAVALGAACYVRPVAQTMAALFVLVLLFRPRRFRRSAVFAGVFLACVGPWIVRNAAVADYTGFSDYAGSAMYYFAAPEAIAQAERRPAEDVRKEMRARDAEYRKAHGEETIGQGARRRQHEALEIFARYPWAYLAVHVKGCLGYWLPGASDVLELAGFTQGRRGTVDVLHRKGLLAAGKHYFGGNVWAMALAGPMILLLGMLYLGAGVCAIHGLRRLCWPAEIWLLVMIVAVSALLPGPFGLPRYRLPITPILAIAAAVGWGRVVGGGAGARG